MLARRIRYTIHTHYIHDTYTLHTRYIHTTYTNTTDRHTHTHTCTHASILACTHTRTHTHTHTHAQTHLLAQGLLAQDGLLLVLTLAQDLGSGRDDARAQTLLQLRRAYLHTICTRYGGILSVRGCLCACLPAPAPPDSLSIECVVLSACVLGVVRVCVRTCLLLLCRSRYGELIPLWELSHVLVCVRVQCLMYV